MRVSEILLEKAPLQAAKQAHIIASLLFAGLPDIEEMGSRGAKYDDTGYYQIRVKPKSKDISPEDALNSLEKFITSAKMKKLKLTNVVRNQVSPNSGKFSSVSFDFGGFKYDIVVALGSNKGQDFEKDLLKKLQDHHLGIDTSEEASEALKALAKEDPLFKLSNISSIEARSGSTKRSGDMTPAEAGAIVADIVITLKKGGKKYISVKNSTGTTIANFGLSGVFNPDNTINVQSEKWKSWVHPFGLNVDYITAGLDAYVDGTEVDFEPVEHPNKRCSKTSPIYKLLHKFWASDYYYLRQKGKSFEAKKVDDTVIHDELLKNLKLTEIRYPHTKSKQVTIFLSSDAKDYKIELRNSKGAIAPNELKFGLTR